MTANPPLPDPDDDATRALAVAAANGDQAAFEGLYEALADPLWRHLHQRLGDQARTEDAHSDTWLAALHRIEEYDPTTQAVLPWMLTLT